MIDFLITAFNAVLFEPIFNILILFYSYIPGNDLGIAIIALTVVIRLALYPSSIKAVKSQKALRSLQPKIKEIQEKHKDDKEKQAKATMELYKKEGVSPFGGCLPILIQLPILIGLFQVLKRGLSPESFSHLYSFVSNPGQVSPIFLGIVNLSNPNVIMALIAAGVQFFQSKMMSSNKKSNSSSSKNQGFAQIMQNQMTYFFPIITFIILLRLPSAIGLYWIVSSLFAIIQQYVVLKKK